MSSQTHRGPPAAHQVSASRYQRHAAKETTAARVDLGVTCPVAEYRACIVVGQCLQPLIVVRGIGRVHSAGGQWVRVLVNRLVCNQWSLIASQPLLLYT
jgi:hypothetical protein